MIWGGEPVDRLFLKIRDTMPQGTPGTLTDSSPRSGILWMPRLLNSSGVAPAPARPLAFSPWTFLSFAL